MKRIIVFFALTAIALQVNGQARLGSVASEIVKEFQATEYNLTTGYDDDGDYYIAIELDEAYVTYYFKSVDGQCYISVIYPKRQGDLNYLVEVYNKRYAILSPTSWRMYSHDGFANIELKFQDGQSYFIWSMP